MSKKKLICITKKPFIEVDGFGRFKRGMVFDFPIRVANHLLHTTEFQEKKEPVSRAVKGEKEPENRTHGTFKKRRY